MKKNLKWLIDEYVDYKLFVLVEYVGLKVIYDEVIE